MVIGLEPILWNGISIMPIQLAMPVDALLYPSNPQAGIELHHNGKKATYHSGPCTTTALLPVTFLPVMGSVSWSNGLLISQAPMRR